MTDPYLTIDEQIHSRPSTLHAHEHDDGRPVPSGPSGPSGSMSPSKRLSEFASHILDSSAENENETEAPHPHPLSFTGEGGVLEGAFDDVEDVVRRAMEDHANQHAHAHGHVQDQDQDQDHGDFEPHVDDMLGVGSPATTSRRTIGRGRKRKASNAGMSGGEALDPAALKRESHKEVERKRRTNINEGIDQLVAQMNLPELDKAGKGVQLRRAVDHMAELGDRVAIYEREVEELRKDKQDLEANLALTSARYTEEHERCTRYETMWRDAQDREAKSQFDIAQLLDELAQLRRRVGEGDDGQV